MCVRRVRVSGTRSLDGTRNGSTRPEVNTGGGCVLLGSAQYVLMLAQLLQTCCVIQ